MRLSDNFYHAEKAPGLEKTAALGLVSLSLYRIVGMTNSEPARMPVGQRVVIVLSLV